MFTLKNVSSMVLSVVRIIGRSRDKDPMPMSDVAFESSLDGNIIDGKYVKQRHGGKHANIEWRLAA
jgi:hypothetical protein